MNINPRSKHIIILKDIQVHEIYYQHMHISDLISKNIVIDNFVTKCS